MKKIIAVICILVVGFAGGFYLSRSPLLSSFTNQKSSAPTVSTESSGKSADAESGSITEDDAHTIALHDADVSPGAIYNMRSRAENYYGVDIYDVEFDTEDKHYNYNIDRQNGNILAKDYEVDERYLRNLPDNPVSEQQAVDLIVQNIPGAQPNDIRLHRDHDDHYLEYEGKITVDNVRYEFTINADKGIITEWDEDYKTR